MLFHDSQEGSAKGLGLPGCSWLPIARRQPRLFFTKIQLHFVVQGERLSAQHVARAVQLSAEKYCSASKMLEAGGVEITHSFEIQAASI